MKRVYACLAGEWKAITDLAMINHIYRPLQFFEKKACHVDSLLLEGHTRYDYIKVTYLDKTYTLNPAYIQIVEIESDNVD